ncbi:MAG TPA: exonuclease sbcCD subunit D [Lachnospiraceae bacterium]|nr:exonuclease sbcCD subunit D [Lachnospiraceae bacterium]
MKFVHTGDLHIGKIVNGFSMLEDQRHILQQIYELTQEEKADALVIAGDIYDRAIPPAEAVVLLNDFLTDMVRTGIPVFMISGNHDSPERIGFAGKILEQNGIHIAGVYEKRLKQVKVMDGYGEITFVLMPFVKPAAAGAKSSGEAVEHMLSAQVNGKEDKEGKTGAGRKVLITHYFVTDNGREPELSDGETTVHVGGLDNVEASLFADFDYVALGHIHKPQKIGEGEIYYAGAPLAYSFSETGQKKTVNLVELDGNGVASVKRIPLKPLHEMRKIRGRLEELIKPEIVEAADAEDYIRAELTDEEELIDPIGTLRSVYPNIMQIVLTKNEKREETGYTSRLEEKRKSIPELFEGFYEMIRGEKPDEERMKVVKEAAEEAEEMNL